jgi:thiol-disulfide isomerase/thioredoxin
MKGLKNFPAVILLLILLSSTVATAAPEDRWLFGATGYARAVELQREMKIPLVVYFYTDWCPYCRSLENQNTGLNRQKLKAQIVDVPPSNIKTDLPTVDVILEKYVAASGGREAQRRITSRVTKARVDVPGVSFGGKLEVYAKAPNKSLTITNVEPMGLVKQGFDGRTGWNLTENGVDVASEVDRVALVDADFYRHLKLKEMYSRINVIDKVKDGFRQVYVVEALPPGGSAEKLYFDVDSGLLVRRDLTRSTSKGSVRAEVYFSDWRDVDGVKIPFRITQVLPAKKFVTTIEEVKHNVPVDDAIFRRP